MKLRFLGTDDPEAAAALLGISLATAIAPGRLHAIGSMPKWRKTEPPSESDFCEGFAGQASQLVVENTCHG